MKATIKAGAYQRRSRYERMINTYEDRRVKLREKYGIKKDHNWGHPKEYTEGVKKLNQKINRWKKTVRRLKKNEEEAKKAYKVVRGFFDIDFRNSSNRRNKTINLARLVYYKYGIECGIKGTHLADYLMLKKRDYCAEGRKKFQKSFKDYPENLILWQKFKEYVKEQEKTN